MMQMLKLDEFSLNRLDDQINLDQKVTFQVSKNHLIQIELLVYLRYAKNRSDFIRRSIVEYVAYLQEKQKIDFLVDQALEAIRNDRKI